MDAQPFAGFSRPQENFYRLPNNWFDLLAQARAAIGKVSIVGMIRLLEYLIKHTWGVGNFDAPIRLSLDELQQGRVVGRANGERVRLDLGTGLDRSSLIAAIQQTEALGLVERISLGGDAARQRFAYALRIAPEGEEGDGVTLGDGFPDPRANYFIVPKAWTDLTARQRSDALIVTVEYLIRHAWGWRSRRDEIHWLSADEVARGRQYRRQQAGDAPRRYDHGTGYSLDKTYTALEKGVEGGLLVWQEGQTDTGLPVRLYTLRRAGWPIGRWQAPPEPEATEGGDGDIHLSHYTLGDNNFSRPAGHGSPPENNLSQPSAHPSRGAVHLSQPRSSIPTSETPTPHVRPDATPPPPPTLLPAVTPSDGGGGGRSVAFGAEEEVMLSFFPSGKDGPRVEAMGRLWDGDALPPDRVLLMGDAPEWTVVTVDLTTAATLLVRGVAPSHIGWSVGWWEGEGDGRDLPAAEREEAQRRQNVVEDLRAVLQANLRDWGHWDLHTALAQMEEMGDDAAAALLQQFPARDVGGHLAALRTLRARAPSSVRNLPGLLRWKLARGEQPPRRRSLPGEE